MAPHASQTRSATEALARLETSRAALLEAIEGLDEEGFRSREAEATWSPAEVLAHLLASEHAYMTSAEVALREDAPAIGAVTADHQEQEAHQASRMPVPQILHGLLARRRETAALLRGLTPEQLSRTVYYPNRGEFALGRLFETTAAHEAEHASQIRDARARRRA